MKTRRNHSFQPLVAACVLTLAVLSGCSRDDAGSVASPFAPGGSQVALGTTDPNAASITLPFDSNNFGTVTTANRFFPLTPGTRYLYVTETPEGRETNTVVVTRDTKTILGVKTTVIRDQVFLEGSLTEDTFDWYAQDKDRNVWYFGEDTKTYDHGVLVTTQGSWEAGKNGAQAGIIMLANPKIGDQYYQEFAPGVVADQGKVLSLKETVNVPYGTFTSCLKTADWTPIEPGNRALKYYAEGIGVVLEVAHREGGERTELTEFSTR
jgi:hypothetical protein